MNNTREQLVAECIAELLARKEPTIQYKHWDHMEWYTPTLDMKMIAFANPCIDWRRKPA